MDLDPRAEDAEASARTGPVLPESNLRKISVLTNHVYSRQSTVVDGGSHIPAGPLCCDCRARVELSSTAPVVVVGKSWTSFGQP